MILSWISAIGITIWFILYVVGKFKTSRELERIYLKLKKARYDKLDQNALMKLYKELIITEARDIVQYIKNSLGIRTKELKSFFNFLWTTEFKQTIKNFITLIF